MPSTLDNTCKRGVTPERAKPDSNGSERAARTALGGPLCVCPGRRFHRWRGLGAREQLQQLPLQLEKRHRGGRRARVQHHVPTSGNGRTMETENLPKAAANAVPRHRVAQCLRCRNAKARSGQAVRAVKDGAYGRTSTPSFVVDPAIFGPAQEAQRLGEGLRFVIPFHGVKRWRPFCRRRFNVLRPPAVRIRTLNPWVLARRRRLGWNVLFKGRPSLLRNTYGYAIFEDSGWPSRSSSARVAARPALLVHYELLEMNRPAAETAPLSPPRTRSLAAHCYFFDHENHLG